MAFHPNMRSMTEGLTVIGDMQPSYFNAAIADIWHVRCCPASGGQYVSHAPRLFVVLEQAGEKGITISGSQSHDQPEPGITNPLCFVPAGFQVWSYIDKPGCLRHLDIHLDVDRFPERLWEDIPSGSLDEPKLMFFDERVFGLARLIATECENHGVRRDLYGDSLICALVCGLAQVEADFSRPAGQLAPDKLRKSIEFIEDNCTRSIRLGQISDLVDLSPAYFCNAFKLTTGMPPHQWQMRARVNRAKQILVTTDLPLSVAAVDAGFSDQAHLTRVFRRIVGTTPNDWRRSHHAWPHCNRSSDRNFVQ